MKSLSFTIPLRPKPKGNTHRRSAHGGIFNAKPTKDHERALKLLCAKYRQMPLWEGPVFLEVYFLYKIPKSGKYKNAKPGESCIADYGDRGNCLKMIEDALEGIIYKNDCQVAWGGVIKEWAKEDSYEVCIAEEVT